MTEIKILRDSLTKYIDPSLIDEMLKDFVDIKRHYISRDYRSTLVKSGTFSETLAKILIYLSEGKIISTKDVKISNLETRLSNTNLHPSLKTVIPRILMTIYKLRSSRGGAHQSDEISPNYIDASYVYTCCNWIVCELLRIYHDPDIDKTNMLINSIMKVEFPILEEIDGETIIFKDELTIRDQILILLLSKYPERTPSEVIKKAVKTKNPRSIANELGRMVKSKLLHRNKKGVILTLKGLREAERVYGKICI